jgi:hypothetical protein
MIMPNFETVNTKKSLTTETFPWHKFGRDNLHLSFMNPLHQHPKKNNNREETSAGVQHLIDSENREVSPVHAASNATPACSELDLEDPQIGAVCNFG